MLNTIGRSVKNASRSGALRNVLQAPNTESVPLSSKLPLGHLDKGDS